MSADACVITRLVEAPRELVWKAFTEAERLMHWFGPKGFVMTSNELDLRPGGTFHYCLRSPQGQAMWGKWTFREIVAPERLVIVTAFSDADGGVTRHPMAPTWPLEMLSVTTFEERDGKTLITVRWSALNASEEEQRTFDDGHAGMQAGWAGTFEQLDAYLAEAGRAETA